MHKGDNGADCGTHRVAHSCTFVSTNIHTNCGSYARTYCCTYRITYSRAHRSPNCVSFSFPLSLPNSHTHWRSYSCPQF